MNPTSAILLSLAVPGAAHVALGNMVRGVIAFVVTVGMFFAGYAILQDRLFQVQLFQPFDVVITPRQLMFGFQRGVYYGYILNKNGRVAFFESGPDGVNGWGFDDVVGSLPYTFSNPKAIQADVTSLFSAIWVVYENPLDIAAGEVPPKGTDFVIRQTVDEVIGPGLLLVVGARPRRSR